MLSIEEEHKHLIEIGFLTPEDSSKTIITNIYQYAGWAEAFWRRKERHEQRPDPELPFILQRNPKIILEIGCGYGRFTKKLLDALQTVGTDLAKAQVIGLEINKDFAHYIELYTQLNPILKYAQFVFSDILQIDTEKFPLCDVIAIPMHMLPYFTVQELDKLFSIVYRILASDGQCIFSIHKNFPQKNIDVVFPIPDIYSGELLVEKNKSHIASLNYSFPIQKSSEGYIRIEYSCYLILDNYFQIKEKIIARHESNIYTDESIQNLLMIKGFKVDFINTESISRVYGISKA